LGYEPDRIEKGIRFGCGGLLGAVIGFFFIIDLAPATYGTILVACAVGAVVCSVLAMKCGDRLWYGLRRWFWPGPWSQIADLHSDSIQA